ncbi:MAG: hypothetical protein AABW56_02765 [Nanoarchaeota archaeon]
MEFLTTYGWAILILLIVIVALANLGIFKGPRTAPICFATAPISCTDVKISGTTLTLIMSAVGTYSVNPVIQGISGNVAGTSFTGTGTSPTTIGSGATTVTAVTTGVTPQSGQKFQGNMSITYTLESGASHITSVSFSGTAE